MADRNTEIKLESDREERADSEIKTETQAADSNREAETRNQTKGQRGRHC